MSPQPPEPESTLEHVLGFEAFEFDGEGTARARMQVVDAVRQPFGIVHGGAYASLAESLCSLATYRAVGPESVALGQANNTTFMRPVSEWLV